MSPFPFSKLTWERRHSPLDRNISDQNNRHPPTARPRPFLILIRSPAHQPTVFENPTANEMNDDAVTSAFLSHPSHRHTNAKGSSRRTKIVACPVSCQPSPASRSRRKADLTLADGRLTRAKPPPANERPKAYHIATAVHIHKSTNPPTHASSSDEPNAQVLCCVVSRPCAVHLAQPVPVLPLPPPPS